MTAVRFAAGAVVRDAVGCLLHTALSRIGVMLRRKDDRIDMPDLFRVAAKLLEKGGRLRSDSLSADSEGSDSPRRLTAPAIPLATSQPSHL